MHCKRNIALQTSSLPPINFAFTSLFSCSREALGLSAEISFLSYRFYPCSTFLSSPLYMFFHTFSCRIYPDLACTDLEICLEMQYNLHIGWFRNGLIFIVMVLRRNISDNCLQFFTKGKRRGIERNHSQKKKGIGRKRVGSEG